MNTISSREMYDRTSWLNDMNCDIRAVLFAAVVFSCSLRGQSTQALISGQVHNRSDHVAIAGAWVAYCRIGFDGVVQERGSAQADSHGYYVLPILSPGVYRLRADHGRPGDPGGPDCFPPPSGNSAFQAQEKHELTLAIAARLEVDFDLRPSNEVWDSHNYKLSSDGMVIRYFGTDNRTMKSIQVDTAPVGEQTAAATLSYVLDSQAISNLPLNGRDLYSSLVLLPGVTSESGTGRGLGLAVNGTRSTSSNFLLDGLENNNYLTTGPLITVAPEAAQEYRISVNNFSAEYGRAAGFIANALTLSGTNHWHGLVYAEGKNEDLNAKNGSLIRRPLREAQWGGEAGGPLVHDRLYISTAFDSFRSRDRLTPTTATVISSNWLSVAKKDSEIYNLLTLFPPPGGAPKDTFHSVILAEQPVSADRLSGLARLDSVSRSGGLRVMGRLSFTRSTQPDFIWSPYPGFNSPLEEPSVSAVMNLTNLVSRGRVNEARAAWSRDVLSWNRAHPEIPTLVATDGTRLPGSPAAYDYRNDSRNLEINDTFQLTLNRHILKMGGGVLARNIDTRLTYARDSQLQIDNLALFFTFNRPNSIRFAVDRSALPDIRLPDYNRSYSYRQVYGFIDDSFRLKPRLTLSVGLRYENFGVPTATGAVKDLLVQPGPGNTIAERVAAATIAIPGTGDEPLFRANNRNFAGRFGLSYSPGRNANTVLRAAYGIFYDRPFDNLWENLANNNFVVPSFTYKGPADAYLSLPQDLSIYKGFTQPGFPQPLYIDPNWKTGYVQSFFAGIEERLNENWTAAINGSGSLGRSLVTTDILNRGLAAGPSQLGPVVYRAPQGDSDFSALSALIRGRTRTGAMQVAYTWSHSIDNQSDPLAGDFFDLGFTSQVVRPTGSAAHAAFSVPTNSRIDRGNSDFDQRQNLVFSVYQEVPRQFEGPHGLLRGWKLGAVGSVRSGLPFTIFTQAQGQIVNRRPNLIDPSAIHETTGDLILLNRRAFGDPGEGRQGNLGRNSLIGPGFCTFDLSLGRTFAIPRLGEAARLLFRADAFNVVNHLNLGQPDANFGQPVGQSDTFGHATYGRAGVPSNFPSVSPLNERPRQVQIIFRLNF